MGHERQLTSAPHGHILTHCGVWSPDSQWIVYDIRSDPAGSVFDGTRIEMVSVNSGEVRVLYESRAGARCGVATFHPAEPKVVFILGPENPTPDWEYNAAHRQGIIVDARSPGSGVRLDARDLTPPFTPGALRGGSHVHVWDGFGQCVSFTYEDHLLWQPAGAAGREPNQRNVGVSLPNHPVRVDRDHPRNHDGDYFSVLLTRTVANPKPGSDEISRACEEGWVGTRGYRRPDGARQLRALAFQGQVVSPGGVVHSEVFIVDLPEDLTAADVGEPLEGTELIRPRPPRGTRQRRLTFTSARSYPGLCAPRHWLRCSPDGGSIGYLAADDRGLAQLWTVSPSGGEPAQLTRNLWPVASAFSWSPDGQQVAHVTDGSVCVTRVEDGATRRLTPRTDPFCAPRPEACVFSPDGKQIAFVRPAMSGGRWWNQVCVVDVD